MPWLIDFLVLAIGIINAAMAVAIVLALIPLTLMRGLLAPA